MRQYPVDRPTSHGRTDTRAHYMNSFEGQYVVVAGLEEASRRRVAERFAQAGAFVAFCVAEPAPASDAFVRGLPGGFGHALITLDMGDEAAIAAGLRAILAWSKQIDVLVVGAEAPASREAAFSALSTSAADFRAAFEACFLAPVLLAQHVVKLMTRRRSGAAVLVGGAQSGLDVSVAGAARRSALSALAAETRGFGLRVSGLEPGEEATPDAIAEAALFMAGTRANVASGQMVRLGQAEI